MDGKARNATMELTILAEVMELLAMHTNPWQIGTILKKITLLYLLPNNAILTMTSSTICFDKAAILPFFDGPIIS